MAPKRKRRDVAESIHKPETQEFTSSGSQPVSNYKAPAWARSLTADDYSSLDAAWISRDIADQAILRRVDSLEGQVVVGQQRINCAGLLIPYYWPGDPHPIHYRVRRDAPEMTRGSGDKMRPDRKYLSAPGSGNRLYLPPGITTEHLQQTTIQIVLVEGEKKALALWRLSHYSSDQLRFIPIAIAGVSNWRGVIGKTTGPKGDRVDVKGPIPDLDRIRWKDRKAVVIFDSNVESNKQVAAAQRAFATELSSRGAVVSVTNVPLASGVNGIDDFLAGSTPEAALELLMNAKPFAAGVVPPPQFRASPEGIFRITSKVESTTQIQLTNYRACILANIRLDDGVETKSEFHIEAELNGQTHRFRVPSSEFARMEWPLDRIGAGAITYPNQREYAKTAIQSLSTTVDNIRVFTHTGWRNINNNWIFLHAGGAIGPSGIVNDARVTLSGSLSHYKLELASNQQTLIEAIHASLRLVELGPASIAFPMLAATFRAVLGNVDFSLHLTGESGSFKSELAALCQQHYGKEMVRLNLPGAWSSTSNSLEALAFHAKDALLVIDDFAPQGNSSDLARCHAATDRVFRAAGNHAGRGRLDSTGTLREPKPPRALILSTGEEVPRGQSIRARMMILELEKGAISSDQLSRRQMDARSGLYAAVMGNFVQWLAGKFDNPTTPLDDRLHSLQERARRLKTTHARTPDIVANLQAAFEIFLQFCTESGALDDSASENLRHRCWEALTTAANNQASYHESVEPAARYIELLRSALNSGRAHLRTRKGACPVETAGCGWRGSSDSGPEPLGDFIGWIDGTDIYLDSAAAYQVVQSFGRCTGEVIAISEQTMRKRLRQRGFLLSVDQTRQTVTVRKMIEGTSKDVLHLSRQTLIPCSLETSTRTEKEREDLSGFDVGFSSSAPRNPTSVGATE